MIDEVNLIEFYNRFRNESECHLYLAKIRWGNEATCPHCDSKKTYLFSSKNLYKCGLCRKQFTARIGTIFEGSKIPLGKWFLAIYLASNLPKGVSSAQLSEYLSITQKSSWLMLFKIKYALRSGTFGNPEKPFKDNSAIPPENPQLKKIIVNTYKSHLCDNLQPYL